MTEIIDDLEYVTGLKLIVVDGKLIVQKDRMDKPKNPHLSKTAKEHLEYGINHLSVTATIEENALSGTEGTHITIGETLTEAFKRGASDNLNEMTLGWGMTFMHELLHIIKGVKDNEELGQTGVIVDEMNKIRRELSGGEERWWRMGSTIVLQALSRSFKLLYTL